MREFFPPSHLSPDTVCSRFPQLQLAAIAMTIVAVLRTAVIRDPAIVVFDEDNELIISTSPRKRGICMIKIGEGVHQRQKVRFELCQPRPQPSNQSC